MLSDALAMENHQHRTACETNTARPRRWLQFRLKWLFVLVAVLAVPLSWLGWKLEEKRRERWAEAELQKFDVDIRHQYERPSQIRLNPTMPGPECMRRVFGDDFFLHVEVVEFPSRTTLPSEMPIYLQYLPQLTVLVFHESQITDASEIHLKKLKRLRFLHLGKTRISNATVARLRSSLPSCSIVVGQLP